MKVSNSEVQMEVWSRKHLNRGGQGMPRPRRAAHRLLDVRGRAGMAEDYKNVPKRMVAIEWEPTLLRWLCLSPQGSKG